MPQPEPVGEAAAQPATAPRRTNIRPVCRIVDKTFRDAGFRARNDCKNARKVHHQLKSELQILFVELIFILSCLKLFEKPAQIDLKNNEKLRALCEI